MTEQEKNTHRQQNFSNNPQTFVDLNKAWSSIFAMPENHSLHMQLQKAKHKRYVVAEIEPVPESTDNKYVELVHWLALDSAPLVYTLSQPLLDTHVPVIYFFTDVGIRLAYYRIDSIDSSEILAVVAQTWGMDATHTKFPSSIVFCPCERYGDGSIEENVPKGVLLIEGSLSHHS